MIRSLVELKCRLANLRKPKSGAGTGDVGEVCLEFLGRMLITIGQHSKLNFVPIRLCSILILSCWKLHLIAQLDRADFVQSIAGKTTRERCCTGSSQFSIANTRLQISAASTLTDSSQSCLAAVKERLLAKSKSADQARLDCSFPWAGLLATSRRANLQPASGRGHQSTWWVLPFGLRLHFQAQLYSRMLICTAKSLLSCVGRSASTQS